MAFQVNFYNFSKRDNSTAIPSGTPVTLNCQFKMGTSILNPTLVLEYASIPAWSYFQMLGRYYKVTDIRSIHNNVIEVDGKVDVLASWKANILASSAFVAYDTTANSEITDKRISTKTTASRQESVSTDAYEILTHSYSQMAAIINVVGKDACVTYATTLNNAKELMDSVETWAFDLVDDAVQNTPHGLTDWIEVLCTFFEKMMSSGSASDCIRSAYILPVNYSLISGTSTGTDGIMLGEFPTEKQGKEITQRWLHDGNGVTIPWQATDWRRNAPYHEIYLYIPFIGVISYPPSAVMGASSFYVDFAIDITNGETIITVSLDSVGGQVIGQYNCNLAMEYAIGSSNVTPKQYLTNIAAGAGGALAMMATGGAAALAIGSGAIAAEFNAMTPIPSSVGGTGGGAILGLRGGAGDGFALRCMTIFHDTNISPASVSPIIGTPTNAVKALSGLTGYVETRNASVSGPMTETERNEINRYLDGGIYIE